MTINKINSNKSFFLSYIPFVIFFAFIFIWHFTLPTANDDLLFSKLYEQNIFSTLAWRYDDWSSRWFIEFFLISISGLPKLVWNFFDSIVFVLIAVLIPKLTLNIGEIHAKKSFIYNSLACIFVLIYIITIGSALASAGHVATTLNYTWPLFFGLLHFYLLKEYIFSENKLGTGKQITVYVLMIFALLFAINQELVLCLVFGAYFFIILYCLYNKVRIPNSIFVMVFIIFLGFLNIFLSPGNSNRYLHEISNWFPDYYKLTLLNKLDLGISILLHRTVLPYGLTNLFCLTNLFFFGVLGVYVYSITRKNISILVGLMPIIIIVTLGLMSFSGYTPIVDFLKEGLTRYGLLHSDLSHIIVVLVIYAMVIIPVIYSLIQINKFKETKFTSLILCLFILGFASQMMRGFSPTCWATGERWEIFYYFFIITVTYILTVDLLENRTIVEKK